MKPLLRKPSLKKEAGPVPCSVMSQRQLKQAVICQVQKKNQKTYQVCPPQSMRIHHFQITLLYLKQVHVPILKIIKPLLMLNKINHPTHQTSISRKTEFLCHQLMWIKWHLPPVKSNRMGHNHSWLKLLKKMTRHNSQYPQIIRTPWIISHR